MLADLIGSVNRININKNNGVFTIFEAVVNSIQSNSKNILVELKTEKEKQTSFQNIDKKEKYILKEVTITDDGYGFNDENFESFKKINSTYKLKLGGKGVGRLTWLKVFENIEIESVYKQEKKYFFRKILFNLCDEVKEIEFRELNSNEKNQVKTTIKFRKLKVDFSDKFPTTAETLGEKILYHCLSYLIEGVFEITIKDGITEYKCKNEYLKQLGQDIKKDIIKINAEEFEIIYIPIDKEKQSRHKISLIANKREVKSRIMIEELLNSSFEINGLQKNILVFVSGNYLDENVSEDRTRFLFPDEECLFLSENEIIETVSKKIIEIFDEPINRIKKKNEEKVNDFLSKYPYYKSIFQQDNSIINEMNDKTTNEQLEEKFEKIVRKKRKEVRFNIKNVKLEGEYQSKFEEITKNIELLNQLDLSKYVLHRKLVLELYDKILQKKEEDSNYFYEKDLHNLIFPMKKSGEEIDYDQHNLWLLDDRLAYNKFLASDLPFKKIKNTENNERADILIFDKPMAFSDKDIEDNHSNVIVVEFKRPGREDLTKNGLMTQIYKYIEELKSGEIKSPNGIRIEVSEQSIFNVFIICELTDMLKKELLWAGFNKMLDEQGYYTYNQNIKAFIQVLSLNKVKVDAKLRNKVFFNKLGL